MPPRGRNASVKVGDRKGGVMAGIGKKVVGAAKKAAAGKGSGGKKGKSPGGSGSGVAKAKKAARDLLK